MSSELHMLWGSMVCFSSLSVIIQMLCLLFCSQIFIAIVFMDIQNIDHPFLCIIIVLFLLTRDGTK